VTRPEDVIREAISYGMSYDVRHAARLALSDLIAERDEINRAWHQQYVTESQARMGAEAERDRMVQHMRHWCACDEHINHETPPEQLCRLCGGDGLDHALSTQGDDE
jgi:hypothetical protein